MTYSRWLVQWPAFVVGLLLLTASVFGQAPANDNFGSAQVLSGTSGTVTGNNRLATSEPGEPVYSSSYSTLSSIWFVWTAPANGALVVDALGSATAAAHAIYTGNTLTALTRIAVDSSSSSTFFEKTPVPVTAGTVYHIAVGSQFDQGDRGNIVLHYVFHVLPKITAQPASRTAARGQTVTFAASATGTELAYQWYRNGLPLAGATSATLTLTDVQSADGGRYFVRVSNPAGGVVSDTVTLGGTNAAPTITTQPVDTAVDAGKPATLRVVAANPGALTYQWRRNGLPIPGATAATYALAAASCADTDRYDVIVADGLSVTISDAVRLDVRPSALAAILSVDADYNVTLTGSVTSLAPVANGQVVAGGAFSLVNGLVRQNLAKLNADGTLDAAFTPAVNGAVNAIAVQGDGKLVIAGAFSSVNNVKRAYLARLNVDGTLDTSFDVGTGPDGEITRIVTLAGGRVLIGGSFSQFNGKSRRRIARLNADGSLDNAFVPFGGSVPWSLMLTDVAVDAEERVLYGNDDFSFNGVRPPAFGRLRSDGSIDPTFTTGVIPFSSGAVQIIIPLSDGRILIGGSFNTYNGVTRSRVARLEADGSIDANFAPSLTSNPTMVVSRLVPARDGALNIFWRSLVFGATLPPQTAFTRLTAASETDSGFGVAFSATRTDLPAVLLLDDGSFLAAGDSFTTGTITRTGLVHLRSTTGAVILAQPEAKPTVAGTNVSLSVTIVGAPNATYQWYKDGQPIDAAVRSTYSITAAQADAAGRYSVRITYTGGSLESNAAELTITPSAPAFGALSVPTSPGVVVQAGSRLALTAPTLAAGSTPLAYQWFKDGVALPGETASVLFRRAWSVADAGDYSVSITNDLGALTTSSASVPVADNPPWAWVNPRPQGNPPSGVQYLNGLFLAGAQRGTILRSIDGLDWTTHRVGRSNIVGPMAYGNGVFVALTDFAGLLSSPDGRTWTIRESDLTDGRTLAQLAFGDGRFVAVGTSGTILHSTDGIAWSAAASPTTNSLSAVAFGEGLWLALSARGEVFGSADGRTWTRRNMFPDTVTMLAYGAGVFVTMGDGVACTSTDGVTWTRHPAVASSGAGLTGLQYTAAGFLVCELTSTGRYLTSVDGLTWVERRPMLLPSVASAVSGLPRGMTFGNDTYVMAAGAPDLLLFSPDNVTWFRLSALDGLNAINGQTLRAIAASPTAAVAVGGGSPGLSQTATAAIYMSNDGANWLPVSPNTTATLNDVAYAPAPVNLFVAVGDRGTIVTSPDGTQWTSRTSGTTAALRGVKYVNDRFLATVGGGAFVLRSADGFTWNSVPLPVSSDWRQAAYGNGRYVVVGDTSQAASSTDGVTWTSKSISAGQLLSDVIFARGKFVAVGNSSAILTSPDGITWTSRNVPATTLSAVTFAGGQFMALSPSQGYFTSKDGETWTAGQAGAFVTMNDAVEFRSRILGVGSNTSILARDLPLLGSDTVVVNPVASAAGSVNGNVTLTAAAPALAAPAFQWQRNGVPVSGGTSGTLALTSFQPVNAGLYTAASATGTGSATSTPAIVGVATTEKVVGTGAEIGADIVHPNGNIFDQVLLNGAAATITANLGQVTRMSFLDLSNDIVQVEFSGAGTLSLVLDNPSGPAAPANYNQAVSYMKGHAGIVITGANDTTHVGVFSVGRVTAVNPALFRDNVRYDGFADLAFIAISSTNGRFGSVRAANASYFATRGLTGLYAPGVRFEGPVYLHNIRASDAAIPVLALDAAAELKVAGGDLVQANGRAVQLTGNVQVGFTAGSDSHGNMLPAKPNGARFERDGADVTAQTAVESAP